MAEPQRVAGLGRLAPATTERKHGTTAEQRGPAGGWHGYQGCQHELTSLFTGDRTELVAKRRGNLGWNCAIGGITEPKLTVFVVSPSPKAPVRGECVAGVDPRCNSADICQP